MRTVGWFTSLFPVNLTRAPSISTEPCRQADLGKALKHVKEDLRAIPGRGLGYGLLRYLDPEMGPRLAARAEPQSGSTASGDSWSRAHSRLVANRGRGRPGLWWRFGAADADLLEINARTTDGPAGPCLTATWSWAARHFREADVRPWPWDGNGLWNPWFAMCSNRALADTRRRTSRWWSCRRTRLNGWNRIIPAWKTSCRCPPCRRGCCFTPCTTTRRWMFTPCRSSSTWRDRLNRAAPAAADALLRRRANLRASIRHDGLERPVQVIPRTVEVPWHELDWSALEGEAQDQRRAELLAADRANRFVPSAGPFSLDPAEAVPAAAPAGTHLSPHPARWLVDAIILG